MCDAQNVVHTLYRSIIMNVSVFGLGYVGAVTSACLAELGHKITGVDLHAAKVDAFKSGKSPIIEPEIDDLLRRATEQNLLSATLDARQAVADTDVSIAANEPSFCEPV